MFIILWSAARGAAGAKDRRERERRRYRSRYGSETEMADTEARERKVHRVERRRQLGDAIARNRSMPVFAGQLLETRNRLVGTRRDLKWVVLDPGAGTLSFWKAPPAEHTASIGEDCKPKGDGEVCAICLEHADSDNVFSRSMCGHWFHEECLNKWRAQHDCEASCPTCRRLLGDVPLVLPPRQREFKGSTRSTPKKAQKVLELLLLEGMDSNPYFRTLFLHVEGTRSLLTLTAEDEEDFERWERIFRVYCDVS